MEFVEDRLGNPVKPGDLCALDGCGYVAISICSHYTKSSVIFYNQKGNEIINHNKIGVFNRRQIKFSDAKWKIINLEHISPEKIKIKNN